MNAPLDLAGQKFNHLTVIRRAGTNAHGQATWVCECECGKETEVTSGKLRNGHTKSCGCIKGLAQRGVKRKSGPKPVCNVDGCETQCPTYTATYCQKHQARLARYNRLHLIRNENGSGNVGVNGYVDMGVNGRRVYQHRLIAEKALGKPLPKGSVVHHANGDRADNRNCNLVICPSEAYHRLLHKRMREFGYV